MLALDYVVIGSIGYAQLGSKDFQQKEKIEIEAIKEIIKNNPETFKIPDELYACARLKMKSFNHDFGTYKELCVIYDADLIEESEDLNDVFWNWVNNMESFDFESEEIIERCHELYKKEYPMQVIIGGKNKGDNDNLKIV